MKKVLSLVLASVMLLAALTACGESSGPAANSGEPNTSTEQTEFNVISGISALSSGYDDNPVLNAMMENVGIKINWETMSASRRAAITCPTPCRLWAGPTTTWAAMAGAVHSST